MPNINVPDYKKNILFDSKCFHFQYTIGIGYPHGFPNEIKD